jgi:hypothetical protein
MQRFKILNQMVHKITTIVGKVEIEKLQFYWSFYVDAFCRLRFCQ